MASGWGNPGGNLANSLATISRTRCGGVRRPCGSSAGVLESDPLLSDGAVESIKVLMMLVLSPLILPSPVEGNKEQWETCRGLRHAGAFFTRPKRAYSGGSRNRFSSVDVMRPPRITTASGYS